MAHSVVWFDIPSVELDRAVRFYSAVMGTKIDIATHGDLRIGVLPHGDGDVAGCLYHSKEDQPSASGPLLYINADGRLDAAIAAVESHGGKVLQAKHSIGQWGWRAIVLDSEGNRIALHSQ